MLHGLDKDIKDIVIIYIYKHGTVDEDADDIWEICINVQFVGHVSGTTASVWADKWRLWNTHHISQCTAECMDSLKGFLPFLYFPVK